MKLLSSGLWFGVVGATAAATHAGVFALAERGLYPELANAVGFGAAFFVSFTGHRWLSFRDTRTTMAASFARFLATALAGFGINELVFILFLRGLRWPPWAALFGAMAVAAITTFILSRFWAFKR